MYIKQLNVVHPILFFLIEKFVNTTLHSSRYFRYDLLNGQWHNWDEVQIGLSSSSNRALLHQIKNTFRAEMRIQWIAKLVYEFKNQAAKLLIGHKLRLYFTETFLYYSRKMYINQYTHRAFFHFRFLTQSHCLFCFMDVYNTRFCVNPQI